MAVVFDREGICHELREPKSEKIKSAEALVALIDERLKSVSPAQKSRPHHCGRL